MRIDSLKLSLPVDSSRDHFQGFNTAVVTSHEYGDFECHYCGQDYPIAKQVQNKLGESLRVVFRNFPLTQSHPHV